MAKNISLLGADYPAVPAVQLPKTGGGTATFYDMDPVEFSITAASGVTVESTYKMCYKVGKIVIVAFRVELDTNSTATEVNIGTIPSGYRPPNQISVFAADDTNDIAGQCTVNANGQLKFYRYSQTVPSMKRIRVSGCWVTGV